MTHLQGVQGHDPLATFSTKGPRKVITWIINIIWQSVQNGEELMALDLSLLSIHVLVISKYQIKWPNVYVCRISNFSFEYCF